MSHTIHSRTSIAVISLFMAVGAATAASPPTTDNTAPSKETREKMATLHEHMAACLRSDKAIAECRSEMMKSCREVMGKDGCPMMGPGMHGGTMQGQPK